MSASSAEYSVGALDAHLVEADLARALARHLVVGDGLDAEMAHGERVHVVRLVALEHVGLEQRVVHDAGEPDAVVREHVRVVLHVLPELRLAGVLEPGLQPRERRIEVELVRCARVAVRERQVGGLVRRDREREADDAARSSDRGSWFRCRRPRAAQRRSSPSSARARPQSRMHS